MAPEAGTLVVAGLWARPLAESARQAGWRPIALDLFGDADTRRASVAWRRIGDPARGAIAPALLRQALHEAARERDAIGWVAGSGFEAIPEALDLVVPGLPLLGMTGGQVQRVRDPASFFALLDQLGLEHPDVSLVALADPRGWIVKNAGGSGGWHIQPATADGSSLPRRPGRGRRVPGQIGEAPERSGDYFQRLQPGEPMSALFVADGVGARLVALNRLLVQRRFRYAGAIGPIRDDALARRLEQALAALVPAFGLRGLASLDFIAHDGHASILEINPRPSASMVLHPHAWAGGLLRAHVGGWQGKLPAGPARHPPGLRGERVVFAERAGRMDTALAAELARSPHCHDLPAAGSSFAAGDPVCSISTQNRDAASVLAALDVRAARVRDRLATCQELPA
jgi:predicted ATP-grasp superfamily ATP-dependent carboligase